MRLLAVAIIITTAALPVMACPHKSPENPTIVLGLLGGLILTWRHNRARQAN